jgi:hypothetical protein
MAGLPWVRLDSNLATHDKILALLSDRTAPRGDRYQAAWSYTCSMGYAGGHGTDGLPPNCWSGTTCGHPTLSAGGSPPGTPASSRRPCRVPRRTRSGPAH